MHQAPILESEQMQHMLNIMFAADEYAPAVLILSALAESCL